MAVPALAVDPPLRIFLRNASKYTLDAFYVRSIGAKDWGVNHLDGSPLQPGAKTQVLHPDGAYKCVIEVRVIVDGKESDLYPRRLCEVADFIFYGPRR